MPWQRLVVDVAGEYDPDTGVPFYREVDLTVMRQQGKSTLMLAGQTDRCISWPRPQRVSYSAQTGKDARAKLLQDFVPAWQTSPLWKLIRGVRRARGEEGIDWESGSLIDVMAGTGSAGHGRTLDLGHIDEAFDDEDDRREQAMVPAMSTREDAQLWVVSTAGTSKSTYLRRKVEAGRHAAMQDRGAGTAYFEWSVPDGEDIDDPDVWWQHMPALGWTVKPAAIRHARDTMEESEFRRAYCNQWTEAEHDRVIPADLWKMCCDPMYAPTGALTIGVDVLPDRSAGAVAAVGGGAAELAEHAPGTGWIVPWAAEHKLEEVRRATFVIDGGGPAAPIADDLERAGLTVVRLSPQEVASACGRMFDSIADRKIKIRTSSLLDAAAAKVAKRPVGDRFVWSRSTSTGDITPLMAMTLGWDQSAGAPPPTPFFLT